MKRIVGEEVELEESKYFGEGVVAASSAQGGMGKRKNEKEFRHDLVCACFVPCFDFFSSVLDNRESETSSGEERERAWRDTDIERERGREREALAGSVPGK